MKKLTCQIDMLDEEEILKPQIENVTSQLLRSFVLLKEIQQEYDPKKIKHLEKLSHNISTALGINNGQYTV